jgi:hypothetical protein
MGTSRFYHLYISPKKEADLSEIVRAIASSTDSIQYDVHNFVLYTMFDAKEWYARLEKYVEPGGKLFICELNTDDYWGFMNSGLWKLLKKNNDG